MIPRLSPFRVRQLPSRKPRPAKASKPVSDKWQLRSVSEGLQDSQGAGSVNDADSVTQALIPQPSTERDDPINPLREMAEKVGRVRDAGLDIVLHKGQGFGHDVSNQRGGLVRHEIA